MQDSQRTLEECLIEAGVWGKEDGAFGTDEHSLGLALERMHRRLARGVILLFYGPTISHSEHEARLAWAGQQRLLASGQSLADAVCNAAMALPDFLKDHPECAS
jgi:hypothetical protein